MLVGQISLVAVHVLLYLLAKAVQKAGTLRNKVARYLYWNGSIRFMVESYLDIVLFSLLNVKSLDWSSPFWEVHASNLTAIALTAVFCGLPLFFIWFYARNIHKWSSDEF